MNCTEEEEIARILDSMRNTPVMPQKHVTVAEIASQTSLVQLFMPLEFSRYQPGVVPITFGDIYKRQSKYKLRMRELAIKTSFTNVDPKSTLKRDIGDKDEKTINNVKITQKASKKQRIKLPSELVCSNTNCATNYSPCWRFAESDINHENPLCNACKLYLAHHGQHRTAEMCNKPKKICRLNLIKPKDRVCVNCKQVKSTFWRFVDEKLYCNPCGQYRRRHYVPRDPIAMNRLKASNEKQVEMKVVGGTDLNSSLAEFGDFCNFQLPLDSTPFQRAAFSANLTVDTKDHTVEMADDCPPQLCGETTCTDDSD